MRHLSYIWLPAKRLEDQMTELSCRFSAHWRRSIWLALCLSFFLKPWLYMLCTHTCILFVSYLSSYLLYPGCDLLWFINKVELNWVETKNMLFWFSLETFIYSCLQTLKKIWTYMHKFNTIFKTQMCTVRAWYNPKAFININISNIKAVLMFENELNCNNSIIIL